MNYIKSVISLTLLIFSLQLFAQPYIVDKVVGVVGKSAILYSDVEEQYIQMLAQGRGAKPDKCEIFEDLLAQKLLVTQAGVDSIEVLPGEVEMELEQRITYFINQIGTEEKLVEYFGKSILDIKDDMRVTVHDQLLMQKMQADIVSGLSITPHEVKSYYNSLHKDSIPYIDSEIEVSQIVIYPESDANAVYEVKEKLLKLRERVLNGESFSTLAVLYSEGPTASRGGDIGWAAKSDLDPAYVKAAMALKKDQVSKIVESSFGYHIIQLVDKTEDRLRTRHILMNPKVTYESKEKATKMLDSLARAIRFDSISFEGAALYYSQDEDTRMNGGVRVNKMTMTSKFKVDEFETSEYYVIRNLKEGQISQAYESTDSKGKEAYKIILLKSRTEPHVANLNQDFTLLKDMALQQKKLDVVEDWVKEKAKDTYIRLEQPYSDCTFSNDVWK